MYWVCMYVCVLICATILKMRNALLTIFKMKINRPTVSHRIHTISKLCPCFLVERFAWQLQVANSFFVRIKSMSVAQDMFQLRGISVNTF